jgi:hypothetical protein
LISFKNYCIIIKYFEIGGQLFMSDYTKALCGDWLNGKTVIPAVLAQALQLHLSKSITAVL